MQDTSGHIEFVHRSWPAVPEQLAVIRRELSHWLAPLGLTEEETADVVLAVDEAGANAVRHAYRPDESGAVELTLWTEPGTLSIEVVDHGSWRPPVADPRQQRGRGIPLMNNMSESVLIHYDDRGSRVLLRHRIHDGPQAEQHWSTDARWEAQSWLVRDGQGGRPVAQPLPEGGDVGRPGGHRADGHPDHVAAVDDGVRQRAAQ